MPPMPTISGMAASPECVKSRLMACAPALLLLLLAAVAAPAQASSEPENRAGEKSAQTAESLLSSTPQLLELQWGNAPPRQYDAPGDSFAPNTGAAAQLRPYGGPGGGHHVPAQSAFRGAAGYDPNAALAIPNAELARLGVRHELVTGAQMTGYRALAQSGGTLTWEAVAQIETQALIRGGMQPATAQATVQQAIQALKNAGVSGPTRIPWGG
jgi:hypothetical protein